MTAGSVVRYRSTWKHRPRNFIRSVEKKGKLSRTKIRLCMCVCVYSGYVRLMVQVMLVGSRPIARGGGGWRDLIEFPELSLQASHDCTANAPAVRVKVMSGIKSKASLVCAQKQKAAAVQYAKHRVTFQDTLRGFSTAEDGQEGQL